jgi:subtilase family serine protease
VDPLVPQAEQTGASSVTVPSTLPPGLYVLLACADDGQAVPESDETNNCRAAQRPVEVKPLPDLEQTAVSEPPARMPPGGSFAVSDTVRNAGTAAAGASTTRYYLSKNTRKDAGDILLGGGRLVPPLEPGAQSAETGTLVRVPAGTEPGLYFLVACADDANAVREGDESNNCRASRTRNEVPALPDLVVTDVNIPAGVTLPPGGAFNIVATIQNIGRADARPSPVNYYLSVDRTRGPGDITFGRPTPKQVEALRPGTKTTTGEVLVVPLGTPPREYFVLACADDSIDGGIVEESDEGNNCLDAVLKIAVTPGP